MAASGMLPLAVLGVGVLAGWCCPRVRDAGPALGGPVAAASVVRGLRRRRRVLGGQAVGGAALVFFLPGVPGVQDPLVADGQQGGGEQHERSQAHEAAPAAG